MLEHDERFLAQLKRHEGYRLEAYRDSVGHLTIGWGHNCDAHPVDGVRKAGDVLSRENAERLLLADVLLAGNDLDRMIPWWRELDEPRAAVLLNMCFNLGAPRLKGFVKALHAVEAGDWNGAAREMLDSKWAVQVKGRAAELATQMVTGAWQEG